jgi:predicted O-methyltransferase YrrM
VEDFQSKLNLIKERIKNIDKPLILELGVKEGRSTKMFLEICDKNDGNLISIDILDYSKVSNNPKWKFIHSSDDNFEYINKFLEKKIDVLFIDSLHEPNHIRKVFYNYFNFVKINGLIFIDDVIWLPYIKNGYRDNDFVETTNRLTFNKILEIFNSNKDNFTLDINFSASGLAVIKKIDNHLNKEKKIVNRLYSFKNILKKFYNPKPKN